ncbi:hypothetical protein JCM10914A_10910 [Paenibacillus sp. JCM 10914]|uniref:hypothetical protein n=1 Tax=Paenibacillus sp. JCM 10914 TaxID=1236974 RepID=UPI0003CCA704|nr:hypothetical protein [Paenibacillus sp. JCM 10914]GAE08162.1 hypothetical protein JCM10914_4429 [Paenibacillus sp. JCM 10914]
MNGDYFGLNLRFTYSTLPVDRHAGNRGSPLHNCMYIVPITMIYRDKVDRVTVRFVTDA